LLINEVMSQNDGAWVDDLAEADDWIELVNVGDDALQLSDFTIEDSGGTAIALPDVVLQTGQHVVLFADDDAEQGALHLPFKLSSGGDSLIVRDSSGAAVDAVEVPALEVNEAFSRVPDASTKWIHCRYATPGRSNGKRCAPPAPVELDDDVEFAPFTLSDPYPSNLTTLVISELGLRPSEAEPAFVELYNAGSSAVLLSDYVLNLSPHKPHQAWPTTAQGQTLTLPAMQLDPGQRVAMAVPDQAIDLLQPDPQFEGVLTLFGADESLVDRLDFMQWPQGATLTRVPDNSALTRFCTNTTVGQPNTCDQLPSRDIGDRVRAMRTPGDFKALAAGAEQLGIDAMKFVVDMQAPGLVHLIASSRWPLHYTFVRELIYQQPQLDRCDPVQNQEFYQGWVEFSNDEYYDAVNRRFLLGTLSRFGGSGLSAVEYTFGDAITPEQMQRGYYAVVAHAFSPSDWALRPQDDTQVGKARQIEGTLPLMSPNRPFVDVTYQPLTEGVAYGTLRFVPAVELETASLGPKVIVVTDDVPNDIALVGGLITEAFQTPLAHVNVLSQNRGTPNASLVGARSELEEYFDQLVRVEVGAGGLDVGLADPDEAAEFWKQQQGDVELVTPRRDTNVRGVQPLSDHTLESLPAIGAKAAQMAELGRVDIAVSYCSGNVKPPSPPTPFAIPVAHYTDHFAASGAEELLEELKADPQFVADSQVRAEGLRAVRDLILNHPVEPGLLTQVEAAVSERYGTARVRFRSSSNTEDLPNFNGAGLYTSISAELDNDDRRVEDAMRTVWASLWNFRAYDERSFANIDDSRVAMGILVHPASLSEEANGVAVSRNVLEPDRGDLYYINVQLGEATVTNPAPGVTTEQLVYQWGRQPPVVYHGQSSLLDALPNPPEHVMSQAEVALLACSLRAVHDWFRPLLDPDSENRWFAMEVEFKLLDGGRQLLVKQARPHSFGRSEFFGDCREL